MANNFDAIVTIDEAAGTESDLRLTTGDSLRWIIRRNSTAEGGSDAGSDFAIVARTDAGAAIDIPITITRAAGGNITLVRPLVTSGRFSTSTVTTFGSADTTPTVVAGNIFKTVDETIALTAFDDGVAGQEITIIGQNSANTCTVSDAGTLKIAGAWTAAADATLTLVNDGTNWYEKSRSAN